MITEGVGKGTAGTVRHDLLAFMTGDDLKLVGAPNVRFSVTFHYSHSILDSFSPFNFTSVHLIEIMVVANFLCRKLMILDSHISS